MKEPKHTCPTLDRLIKIVKDAIKELQYHERQLSDSDCDIDSSPVNSAIGFLDDIVCCYRGIAEEVRSNNIELRSWGQYLLARCEELESELAESYSQMAKAERDKNDYTDFLYNKIEALEEQLQYMSTQTEL